MGQGNGTLEGVDMNADFWRGRRVFITGHTGFKGSWLAVWLADLGAEVTGYSLPAVGPVNLFTQAGVARDMHSLYGDVRDLVSLQQAVNAAQPEIILHLAAQALVRTSYQEPVQTYATNVMGTVHVLEAARQCPQVRCVLNVTTDKCYENREWVWGYRETERLGGHDPYSSSKACSELVTAAYRHSFFSPGAGQGRGAAVASARAGNVIGGGDYATDRLLPDILAAFTAGKSLALRNPGAIRPWQHVLEPLRGYLMLAERLYSEGDRFAQAWNLGPRLEDTKTVQWIVERLATLWGAGARWHFDVANHPHEAYFLRLDTSKANETLHWRPALPLDIALEWTVQWHREVEAGASACTVMRQQIKEYTERLKGERVE